MLLVINNSTIIVLAIENVIFEIELKTLGSAAVRHVSAARHITDSTTRPGHTSSGIQKLMIFFKFLDKYGNWLKVSKY